MWKYSGFEEKVPILMKIWKSLMKIWKSGTKSETGQNHPTGQPTHRILILVIVYPSPYPK